MNVVQDKLDAMMEIMRKERGKYHLTLGELIAALEELPPDFRVILAGDTGPSYAGYPSGAHSYRGYYSDLAFEPSQEPVTAGEFLTECKTFVGFTFEGYKGGDFTMTEDTPLWVAHCGSGDGRAIIDAVCNYDHACLELRLKRIAFDDD